MMFVVILAAFLPLAALAAHAEQQENVLKTKLLNGAPCDPGSDEFVCKNTETCANAPQLGDGSKTRCIIAGLECASSTQKLCGDCCCSTDTNCVCHDVATDMEPKANCRCSTKGLGAVCNPDAPNDECWNLPEGVTATDKATCKTASDGKKRCLPETFMVCPGASTPCAQYCCFGEQTCECTNSGCKCEGQVNRKRSAMTKK